uniref:reverse transcriptase family protein n=2 Tax=Thiolapillus sp. TaxID=2017437 RepID=UPI003AF4937F
RTGNLNNSLQEDEEDIHEFIQSELCGHRQSQDKIVNAFGRMLLEMCATCNLTILNGTCPGDELGNFTYVCSTGSSTIDYFISSIEIAEKVVKLEVTERFESKHLPVEVQIGGRSDNSVPKHDSPSHIEKLIWDDNKRSDFEENVRKELFVKEINRATISLRLSVDEAVKRLSECLLTAAHCMVRNVYTGPRQSVWFDCECKTLKRELRKWYRKFRRAESGAERQKNRIGYITCRKRYRTLIKNKKQNYKIERVQNLLAKSNDPKQFWREVRSVNRVAQQQPKISEDEWFNHFKSVLGTEPTSVQPVVTDEADPLSADELDCPITESEITRAVEHLKTNKSPGMDGIYAEMIKNSLPQILPFLVVLFNRIFDLSEYPTAWTNAIIVPIHKSGDKNDPDNYRGISLLSILGKVFAHILNKRLSWWQEVNNKIVEEQSGFRTGYCTMDNVFVLYAIVQRYLIKKSGKVYVCFVDFKKAFDTINRGVLWNVLRKAGVGGKMLKILQSMYNVVKSCVRCPESLTDLFDCPSGVRQGCVLSPTLFSFVINELALEVAKNGSYGIQLTPDIIQILIMLFADDVILTSYCVKGLQTQINILKQYADSFSMTVNMCKTKIIVFRKGGFLGANEAWWFGNEAIEVVNCYKYLGLHFTTKLSLTQAVSELATKAKARTAQILKCLWRLGHVHSEVFFKIYNAQILPVLMYGSELWGYQRFDVIEKAHLFACKRLLNVGLQTPNNMVLGDLGRFPIFILTAVRCIKFWLRILRLPEERLTKKAYSMLLHLQENGKKTWTFRVMQLICTNGFGEVWFQQGVGDVGVFLRCFRQRLVEQYTQDWAAEIETKERYEFYSSFKCIFQSEKYINYQQKRCFRDCYIQFRFGISPIHVHRMRYKKDVVPRQLLCPLCKNEIEDESHVLFRCSAYNRFRKDVNIITSTVQNTSSALSRVMAADDEESIIQLSRFLYRVFDMRKRAVCSK